MAGNSDPDRSARRIDKAVVGLCVAVYAALAVPLAVRVGVTPAEALPEITWPLEVISHVDLSTSPAVVTYTDGRRRRGETWLEGAAGLGEPLRSRWVFSQTPPRVSINAGDRRLPLLLDSHATCHLSYAAIAARELAKLHEWVPRGLVALLGALAIVLVHRMVRTIAGGRTALVAAALAATGIPLAIAFTGARYDTAMACFGVVAAAAFLIESARSGRDRWLWLAALAAGAAISANLTAAVPLGALAVSTMASGVPLGLGWKKLAGAAVLAGLWLVPIGAAALAAPQGPAKAALSLDADGIAGLVDGVRAGGIVVVAGLCIFAVTLATLVFSVLRAGPLPRRRRIETVMLGAAGMAFGAALLFPRPHRDSVLVATGLLFSIPSAVAFETLAGALEGAIRGRFPAGARKAPAWAYLAAVACVPLAVQVVAHVRLWAHLRAHPAALLDRAAQRELSDYLVREHIRRPITVAAAMLGQIELLTAGRVRPLHAYPMLEAARTRGGTHEDLRRTFRRILEIGAREPRFAILPGTGGSDGGVWAEAVRAAFVAQARLEPGGWHRAAAFGDAGGQPLFVVYRIGPRPPDTTVTEPPLPDDAAPQSVAKAAERERPASPQTLASLGGLAIGDVLGDFVIESISEPFRGAILVHIRSGAHRGAFELRRHTDGVLPVASAGELAIYYRRPERGVTAEQLGTEAKALAQRLEGTPAASTPPAGLTPLPPSGISL